MLVADKEVSEMFFRNDLVVIICEHPEGATEEVFGRLGVVMDIVEDEGVLYYEVKDVTGSEYTYEARELRNAEIYEVQYALTELIKTN